MTRDEVKRGRTRGVVLFLAAAVGTWAGADVQVEWAEHLPMQHSAGHVRCILGQRRDTAIAKILLDVVPMALDRKSVV